MKRLGSSFNGGPKPFTIFKECYFLVRSFLIKPFSTSIMLYTMYENKQTMYKFSHIFTIWKMHNSNVYAFLLRVLLIKINNFKQKTFNFYAKTVIIIIN